MRDIMAVRVGSKYLVVPRLIGATLVLIAIIMLVVATSDVVLTWDRIKAVESCVYIARAAGGNGGDDLAALTQLQTCAILGQQAGVQIRLDGKAVPDEEKWNAMLPKVAAWLGWVLLLVIALLIYQSGKLVLPVEERYTEAPAPAEAGAGEEPKKTARRRTRKSKKK